MRCSRRLIVIMTALAMSVSASAQGSLSIVDALPPYLLSAFLLGNGHFSITTAYTGVSKPLIYREDGSGNRPVNYTSHVHIKVDNTVYSMPYELDETTGQPPANQITVRGLYRDTVSGRPRVNADMFVLHGPGDTIGVVFTMEPVKRPSGAFIRLSVTVQNRGIRDHDVGVLMLIDTKIGDNDRAPIATSFGYRTIETEYRNGIGTGMPEYWIALEGTPVGPGLTARGNLIASELVTPDLFVLGNWVDDPNRGTIGLRLNQWDERLATGFDYSDSSVLLIWDPTRLSRGQRMIRAATEIGLVDSLEIGRGGGSGGGGGDVILAGPGIGGGSGGCISIDTVSQIPCSLTPYHPYTPDTLAPLFLITNTAGRRLDNVVIDVTSAIPGVDVVQTPLPIIPGTLDTNQTGVGSISLAMRARLNDQTYAVPLAIRADGMVPPMLDTVCITVPGVRAVMRASDVASPALCPTMPDTIGLPININGPRCLPMVELTVLGTTTATIRMAAPLPFILGARGTTVVPIEVVAPTVGTFPVQVRVRVREFETLRDGDTTWLEHIDTVNVTITGKLAEYRVVGVVDTIDLGEVCIDDTLRSDQLIENVGGCDVTITSMSFTSSAGGRFGLAPTPAIPITFARQEVVRPQIRFASPTPGVFVGTLRVESVALPGARDIAVRATVVTPRYTTVDTIDLDTICTNVDVVRAVAISTPVNCPAQIDSVDVGTGSITTSFSGAFTVPPRGSVSIPLTIRRTVDGPFVETVTIRSASAGDRSIVVRGVVGTARLLTPPTVDVGDVRVGAIRTITVTITHQGSLPLTITQMRSIGPSGSEYAARPAGGQTLPLTIAPNTTLDIEIDATPTDIETRPAQLFITTARAACDPVLPIELTMRGIRPLLGADRATTDAGRQCIGAAVPISMLVRNRGNAPLRITGVRTAATDLVVTSTFPIVLDQGDSAVIRSILSPSALGVQTIGVRIDHDGEFAVQADSVLYVVHRGILCGTIAADSTVGVVGDVGAITIRWIPSPTAPITLDRMIALLDARSEGIRFAVAHDPRVIRGRAVSGGVVLAPSTTLMARSDTIRVDAPQPQGTGTDVLARIDIDLLRGGEERTDLRLAVDGLASGDADVLVLPGQVRSLLCAYDGRALIVPGFGLMRLAGSRDLVGVGVVRPARLVVYSLDGRYLDSRDIEPTSEGVVRIPAPELTASATPRLLVLTMDERVAILID